MQLLAHSTGTDALMMLVIQLGSQTLTLCSGTNWT